MTALVYHQGDFALAVARQEGSGSVQIGLDALEGRSVERQVAFAVAATDHAHASIVEVDVDEVDHDQLADAHARRAEQTQHRVVAQTLGRVAALQEGHERSDLVVLDGARQRLLHLGRANALGGIAGDFTHAAQVLEEGAQRGRLAGDRRAGVATIAQVQKIGGDLVTIDHAQGEISSTLAFGLGPQVVGELK